MGATDTTMSNIKTKFQECFGTRSEVLFPLPTVAAVTPAQLSPSLTLSLTIPRLDVIALVFMAGALFVSVVSIVTHLAIGATRTVQNASHALADEGEWLSARRSVALSALFAPPVSDLQTAEAKQQFRYVYEVVRSVKRSQEESLELARHIVTESRRASYDPLFVAAVIKSESTFNRQAVSPVGAIGLMQLLPNTAQYISKKSAVEWEGHSKLTDASYNIRLGIAYLKYLEGKFKGDRRKVLIAYNWGPNNLFKALKGTIAIPGSPVKYAEKIISNHSKYSREFQVKLVAASSLSSSLG